jgi:hypothetical protein
MMKIKVQEKLLRFFLPFYLIIFTQAAVYGGEIPRLSSKVYLQAKQLVVEARKEDGRLDDPRPYVIRGINWSASTSAPQYGPSPIEPEKEEQYGFFFDWPGRNPQGHEVFVYWLRYAALEHYASDIPLMKEMNVNTVRVYTDFSEEPAIYEKILDEFYRNGIMLVVTVCAAREDFENGRYLRIVQAYKDHPAILFWILGNEWNLDYNKYWGYQTVEQAAQATEAAAKKIKRMDRNHPVSSVLGDRFNDPEPKNTISNILQICRSVDLWGINVYRGKSFQNLFDQWQEVSDKPFYLSEFGTDSFCTRSFEKKGDYQADNCQGEIDEELQAEFDLGLWQELMKNLAAFNADKSCLGGFVFEFNDELWKVGSYHVGLGGLLDYSQPAERDSCQQYNSEGYALLGAHPDDVGNEEYFGVVTASRQPKAAYWKLKDFYACLADLENFSPKITPVGEKKKLPSRTYRSQF